MNSYYQILFPKDLFLYCHSTFIFVLRDAACDELQTMFFMYFLFTNVVVAFANIYLLCIFQLV